MVRRHLLCILMGINFLSTLGLGVSDAFFSLYVSGLGARGICLAVVLTLYAVSKCVFSPLVGWWAARLGAQRTLTACLLVQFLIAIGYLIADELFIIALLRVVQGGVAALFRPLMLILVSDLGEARGRGRLAARIDLTFYAALALGPLLGGLVADHCGYAGVYGILAMTAVVSLALASTLPTQAGDAPIHTTREHVVHLWDATRAPSLRGLLIYIFGRTLAIAQVSLFWPMLLSREVGLSLTQTGTVLAANSLMTMLLLGIGGRLADRCSGHRLVFGCSMGATLGFLAMAVVQGYGQALLLAAAMGGLSALAQPACTSLLLQQGECFERGVALSLFHFVLNLGFVAGPLLGGALLTYFGLTTVFVVTGLLSLVTSCWFLFLCRSAPIGVLTG